MKLEQKCCGILKDGRETHDDEVCSDHHRCHNQQQDHDDCDDPGASPPGPSIAFIIPIIITNGFTLLTGLMFHYLHLAPTVNTINPPNAPKR